MFLGVFVFTRPKKVMFSEIDSDGGLHFTGALRL